MTNNKLGGSPMLDLPVLILLILVLVITMHTTISQILYPSRKPFFEGVTGSVSVLSQGIKIGLRWLY
jgi:hypothetical protein